MTDWRNRVVGHGEAKPDELAANPQNWRTHPQSQQAALSGAIADVGFIRSVTVNKTTGHVVDGHLRVALAIKEKQATIPVEYVELTEAEEREAILTLDPIAAMAQANKETLAQLLETVNSGEAAVQQLMADIAKTSGLDFGKPAVEDVEPQIYQAEELRQQFGVETGQLWQFGEHRLFVGSAEQAHITCNLAIYDPPYDWSYQQQDNALSWVNWQNAALMGLDSCMPLVQRSDFNHWWVWDTGMARFGGRGYKPMSGCAIILAFGDKRRWFETEAINCLQRNAIEHFDWPIQVVKIQDHLGGMDRKHDEKPQVLCQYIVSLYSQPGDMIGDPFAGVGSFLLAAHATGRRWYGSEIKPTIAAVLIDRAQRAGLEVQRVSE